MQVNEKKRDGIEAEQEECRSVLGTPGEIGEAAEKFHGCVKGSGPEKRQAQAKKVEGQNALCPQGEKAGGRPGRTAGGGPGFRGEKEPLGGQDNSVEGSEDNEGPVRAVPKTR